MLLVLDWAGSCLLGLGSMIQLQMKSSVVDWSIGPLLAMLAVDVQYVIIEAFRNYAERMNQ